MKLKMPLKMHKILSLTAFILALFGGILVLASALGLGHSTIGSFAIKGLVFLFGLGAIFGGWLIYSGVRKMGGIITMIAGIILFVLTGGAGTSVLHSPCRRSPRSSRRRAEAVVGFLAII